MAGHLLANGFPVAIHTRTRAKAETLLGRGATWAQTPAEAAGGADVVCTMVGYPADVRAVYFGADGVLSAARRGQTFIDFTTTEPGLAVEIAEAAQSAGAAALDAPVSGGDVGARNATLTIMAGGDEAALGRIRPVLEAVGKTITHVGGPGAGQHVKMCNQVVIAGTMIGVCESLVYAQRAGLDPEKMLAAIRGGAAGCWSLENYVPRMLRRDFEPGFFVEHFVKDMGIALREAERMKLALPGLALVHQLYVALMAQGDGRKGTQSLLLALERLSPRKA
jgi:3-hydroxyisobutyrate dehydrogenase